MFVSSHSYSDIFIYYYFSYFRIVMVVLKIVEVRLRLRSRHVIFELGTFDLFYESALVTMKFSTRNCSKYKLLEQSRKLFSTKK